MKEWQEENKMKKVFVFIVRIQRQVVKTKKTKTQERQAGCIQNTMQSFQRGVI